jgi:hypothetical protein
MSNMYGYSDYDGPNIVAISAEHEENIVPLDTATVDCNDHNENDDQTNPLQAGFWMEGDSMAPPCGTSISTIHKILQFLKINRDDILYDLGCGDGRICLEAWSIYQCQAIGVEVEKDLVDRAETLLSKITTTSRTSCENLPRFFYMDLRHIFHEWFNSDVTIDRERQLIPNTHQPTSVRVGINSPLPLPTIVVLYLLPEALLEIKAQLTNLLCVVPTCRIVCNTWGIPHWTPTQEQTVIESGVSTTIFVYTHQSLQQ